MATKHLDTGSHFDLFTQYMYTFFEDEIDEATLCWMYNILQQVCPDEMKEGLFPSGDMLVNMVKLTDEQEEFIDVN